MMMLMDDAVEWLSLCASSPYLNSNTTVNPNLFFCVDHHHFPKHFVFYVGHHHQHHFPQYFVFYVTSWAPHSIFPFSPTACICFACRWMKWKCHFMNMYWPCFKSHCEIYSYHGYPNLFSTSVGIQVQISFTYRGSLNFRQSFYTVNI